MKINKLIVIIYQDVVKDVVVFLIQGSRCSPFNREPKGRPWIFISPWIMYIGWKDLIGPYLHNHCKNCYDKIQNNCSFICLK